WSWMRVLVMLAVAACGAPVPAPSASRPPAPPAPPAPPVPPPARASLVPRGAIAVGDQHACAIGRGGKVACWGKAGDRLGPAGSADRPSPVEIAGLDDVAGLAASRDTTCAWTARGEAWCWGGVERDPRAGDGRPRRVPHLHDVVQ